MKKRVTSILLTIAMVLSLLPATVVPASAATTRCGITADRQKWESTNSLPYSTQNEGAKYYYLKGNVSLSDTAAMPGEVYLDLNGHNISGPHEMAAVYWYTTLKIYNSSTNGGTINCGTWRI